MPTVAAAIGDDRPRTVPALLEDLTARFGPLPAIEDAHDRATYAELDARSADLARAMLLAGVGKGSRVGILMPNGADYLVALFACLRIGAVAVLISTLARPRELAQMIGQADCALLLSADAFLRNDYAALLEEALPGLANASAGGPLTIAAAPFLRGVWMWGPSRPAWASEPQSVPQADEALLMAAETHVAAHDAALIIFTSGSSAEPKAVIHSHENLVRQGLALAALMGGCGPGDRLLTAMPFFWVGGLCTVVMAALCSGTAVICPADPSLDATVSCLRDRGATHIMHWPQQLAMMQGDPDFAPLLADMRPAYAHQFALFGRASAELTANSLGMTETLGPHSMWPFGDLPVDKAGSFGIAVGGIERLIVDPETGDPLPPGEYGRLCLRGGALMTGMSGKDRCEMFDERGFYHTDDIARIDGDGHLFFAGRGGDIVKINGANVSPVEIEGVLCGFEAIKAACVVALTGADGDTTLVAAVVAWDGASPEPAAIRTQLKSLLSSYKVPRHVVVLAQADLPMTATGKIFKPRLAELLRTRIEG